MSMDGAMSEVGSRPPSESGDHPSKEAHKKGRFKVRRHAMLQLILDLKGRGALLRRAGLCSW